MSFNIFQACEHGDVNAVRTLLDEQPDLVHAIDASNNTPLTQALQRGNVDIVRELITRHADPRKAQVTVAQTEQNAEAFALVREASLRADTMIANQSKPSAEAPASSENNNAPPANLPPPEIARMIPCKFFPNCRYGERCIFQHPVSVPLNAQDGTFLPTPPGMFFAAPNGMPLQPPPNPYGVPAPYMDMSHPMFQVPFGPNGVPMYPAPINAMPGATETNGVADSVKHSFQDAEAQSQSQPDDQAMGGTTDTATQTIQSNKKAGKTTRHDSTQRGRPNGVRPSCAFFARSACRYSNECRFPHVLPDGTDARNIPSDQDARLNKNTARRTNQSSDRRNSDGDGSSSGSMTPQTKKGNNARRPSNANHVRGKGSRRSTAQPSQASRKTPAQRVPNSDEFPALPGGTPSEPTAVQNKSYKANFSAILSAPAPPKPAKAPSTDNQFKPSLSKTTTEEPEMEQNNATNSTISTRDFAAVAAAQPNAVTA